MTHHQCNYEKKILFPLLVFVVLCAFFMSSNALFAKEVSVLDLDRDGRIVLSGKTSVREYQADDATLKAFLKAMLGTTEVIPNADDKKLLKKFPGINIGEIYAIIEYSMGAYVDSNKACRDKTIPASLFFRVLLSALNKLPDYRGTVYRVDFFQDEVTEATIERRMDSYRQLLKKGESFIPLAVLSTTLGRKESYGRTEGMKDCLAKRNSVILEIESLTGKRIDVFSAHPEEEEVVFLPGTCFQITNITATPVPVTFWNPTGKSYRVFLQEQKKRFLKKKKQSSQPKVD